MIRALLCSTLFLAVAQPAAAQPQCDARDRVLALLDEQYGETRRAMGLAGAGDAVMELFASDDTGTWTITVTMADGVTCLVASGAGYDGTVAPGGDPA